MIKKIQEYGHHFVRYFRQWWKREPHLIVGPPEDPYLRRWWLIPRNPLLNIYLHKFLCDDDDRALHGHPWVSLSILIKGSYTEHRDAGRLPRNYYAPSVIPRGCPYPHRVELMGPKENRTPAWTIFITGPWMKRWGFYCPKGWVPWEIYIEGDGTEVNRIGGCPE